MHKKSIVFIIAFLMLFMGDTAQAESVLIRTKSGAEGQGWLFGAQAGEKCWIAAPVHVVTSPETGALEPFYFFDSSGNTGESSMPVAAAPMTQDSAADREASDLAFARVRLGRSDGQCHSRLGLPLYAYQTILGKTDGFSIANIRKTSYGTVNVRLDRKSVDRLGGAVIDFGVDNAGAEKILHKGISGATITAYDRDRMQPIAMVLRVREDEQTLRALRYDYVKALFDKTRFPDDPVYRQSGDYGGIAYTIVQAKYLPLSGDSGVHSLTTDSGCWKAAALGGDRMVELVMEVRESMAKVDTIEVLQSVQCTGNPVKFWVDQRPSSSDAWTYVASCTSQNGINSPCRIALSGPREFRLRFEATQPVVLSGLRLR